MKMLSTMLYNEVETCAIMEGRAYRRSSVESESVPNDNGEYCAFITGQRYKKNTYYIIGIAELYVIYDDMIVVNLSQMHLNFGLIVDLTLHDAV